MSTEVHGAGSSPLLERSDELERLEAALAAAREGSGVAVIVEGSAGIGKTALLASAHARASASGMQVLAAGGSELEAGYPFGIVRQCFEPALRGADAGDRERLLSGSAGLAGPVLMDVPHPTPASFGVLHGLYWLCANLAERQPLLITVDDAHWADEPSLRFLSHLLARIESLRAAVIIAIRPVDPSAGEPGRLIGFLADRHHEFLAPAPLGVGAVAALLGRDEPGSVDEQFARACHDATGGNPFLLTELERTLRAERVPFTAAGARRVGEVTPPQVARSVRARLARLSPPARALARAAVVLSDDAPLELSAQVAGLDLSTATAAADELCAAGLVDAGGRLMRFRHPLVRSAVAGSLTRAESREAHLIAVQLLRARGAPPERIAVHLLATTPTGDAADAATLRTAAARAVERGAPEGAVPLLRRALEEPAGDEERARLLLELGRAKLAAGQIGAAVEDLEMVVRYTGDVVLRARALVPLLQNISTRDTEDLPSQLTLVAHTLVEVRERDRELWLRLLAYQIMRIDADGHIDPALLDPIDSLAGDTPGEAVALAHSIFRRIKLGASADEIAAIAERAARQLDALVEDGSSAIAFTAVILGLRWSDRLDLAERLLARAVAIARRRGSMLDFANTLDLRSELYMRRGLLRDAEADARDSLATGIEKSWLFARGVKPLLQSLAGQGRTEEAEQIIGREFGDGDLPNIPPMIGLVYARAEVMAAMGRHAAAIEAFDDAVRRGARWGGTSPSQIGDILIAARCHRALGDDDAAGARIAEADALARQWGTPGALGQVLHARAMVHADGARLSELREAAALLERSPARLELASALVDLGAALRRAGYRRDARDPLREGYELARVCGAEPVAVTARHELAASGVRVQRERLTGAGSLTPSERRVAQMAVNGGSNADIAQSLFITVKTVEMHLTNIYRKLEITGRAELALALEEPAAAD